MRADPATEREVFAAVDAFFDHVANGRLEETLRCFAPDADVALYGSEVSEAAIGPEALRRFFTRLYEGTAPRFTFGERTASARGNVAWFTAECSVAAGGETVAPYRLTGILEKRGGRWLWVLFNGSEPVPDRDAEFIPLPG